MRRTVLAVIAALSAALLAAPIANATSPSYTLFGDAMLVHPGNASPTAAEATNTGTHKFGGVAFSFPAGLTVSQLNNLATDYKFVAGSCENGSPRFEVTVTNGTTTGNIFFYIGPPPNYTLCPPGLYANTGNLASPANLVDDSQLGGMFYDPYADAQTKFGSYTVLEIALVVDDFAAPQTVDFDNTQVNNEVFTYESEHPTSTAVKCSPDPVVAGNTTTCTATVKDEASSGATTPTGTVSFKREPGPGTFSKASCKLSGSGPSASCSVTYTPGPTPSEPVRSDTITAEYGGDEEHEPSKGTTTVTVISPTALASGSFVIGDENATVGKVVTFSDVEWWGSNWWKENSLSGGQAPSAFKGFAESSPSPPTCGETWTTSTGNSSGPPPTVPEYMAVIAASKITQSGSTISGNAPEVVVVKTNPGYGPNPGHKGTGKVVAILCKS
jgi:hypothetical protein